MVVTYEVHSVIRAVPTELRDEDPTESLHADFCSNILQPVDFGRYSLIINKLKSSPEDTLPSKPGDETRIELLKSTTL